MKTKITKMIGLCLMLVMLIAMLGVFSLTASAAEDVIAWNDVDNDGVIDSGEATFNNLSEALTAGGIVKLATNYTLGENSTHEQCISMSSGTAILDFNGYMLTCASLIQFESIVLSGTADLTFTDSKTTGELNCASRPFVDLSGSAKLTIAGGIIHTSAVYTQYYLIVESSDNAKFEITGGTHYSNPTQYVAKNHKVTTSNLGTDPRYTVSKIETNEVVAWHDADDDGVIDSGEQMFSDMDSALAANVDLKMNSDVFRDSQYYPPGSFAINSTKTIDLNGYTISATAYCFEVKSGVLTIKDSAGGGQIWCQRDDNYSAISIYGNSSDGLIIESGTILGSIAKYSSQSIAIFSGGNYTFDPSKYIKDSTLVAGMDQDGLWGIRPKADENCTVEVIGSYLYNGGEIIPTLVVKDSNGNTLTEGIDYTVSLSSNVNAGTANVTVTFINDYRGTVAKSFTIGCDHSYSQHTTGTDSADGTHKYTCTVCSAVASEAHVLIYSANDDENTITESCNKSCGHSSTATLKAPVDPVYDGAKKEATVEKFFSAVHQLTYNISPVDAGSYTATLTVFDTSVSVDFTILPATISSDMITVNSSIYTGGVQTLNGTHVVVKFNGTTLQYGTDFYIVIADGVTVQNVGDYIITVCGKGNYTGSVDMPFTVTKATPVASDLVLIPPSQPIYDGNGKSAEVTLSDSTSGIGSFIVKYYDGNGDLIDSPTNAGTYTVKIDVAEGNNYKAINDLVVGTFTIAPKPVGEVSITVSDGTTYNGSAQPPIVTVDGLDVGTDYTVSWDKQGFVNAGTYTATIKGKGNYTGVVNKTYIIAKKALEVDVSSPISMILPGNTILLTVDCNSTELPSPSVTVTNGTSNGLKVTANNGLVIGQDSVTITVYYTESTNYTAGSDTITLDVGVADFSGAIDALEGRIEELKAEFGTDGEVTKLSAELDALKEAVSKLDNGYATDAELAETIGNVNNTITSLTTRVKNLEDTYATKTEVNTLRQDLNDQYGKLLELINANTLDIGTINTTLGEINTTLATLATKTDVESEISRLGNLITALTTRVSTNETAISANAGEISSLKTTVENLATELRGADEVLTNSVNDLTLALTTLTGRVDTAEQEIDALQQDLADAIKDLDAAMKKGDADLSAEIASLNTALTNAKAALEKADADNKAELIKKIEEADKALDDAIKTVQKNLDDAKTELDKAIKDGDTALDTKITNLNTALTNAVAALEQADTDNKAELVKKIEQADASLQAAIDKVASDLAKAQKDLADAIATGDATLSSSIASVSASLSAAKTVLEKSDADNKAALEAKIEAAEATLDAAIKAVQKNLDDAKAELNKAIADGDTELDGKISALGEALATAKAALETTDSANKSELTTKIDEADAALQAAINALSNELNATNEKVAALETFIIIVCVISGVAFCGCGTLAVFYIIDKRKKI